MNEDLFQYIWNYKLFSSLDFKDIDGESIEILDFGKWNHHEGPDFLIGKVKYKGVEWVGHIEMHIKTSDWINHRHSENPNFDNIILHVVYQHDRIIKEHQDKHIPTLALDQYIDQNIIEKYQNLQGIQPIVPCQDLFTSDLIPLDFYEKNLLRKLDQKAIWVAEELQKTQNNYEAVLFRMLAYAYGLKVNASHFLHMVEEIDFGIINKIRHQNGYLEALLLGCCHVLDDRPKDEQSKKWKDDFNFISKKYNIKPIGIRPLYFKLRPQNFPTIRLSQLANVYHEEPHLFSRIINAVSISELKSIFKNKKASAYWDNHFTLGKPTNKTSSKKHSDAFVDSLLINAILPLKYAYHKDLKEDTVDQVLSMYADLKTESNSILDRLDAIGFKAKNALESQALLFHFKDFCTKKKCLFCSVGYQILKK